MRKILDKTDKGELWMEVSTGLPVYHIDAAGGKRHATTSASKAKTLWRKVNAGRGPEKQGAAS